MVRLDGYTNRGDATFEVDTDEGSPQFLEPRKILARHFSPKKKTKKKGFIFEIPSIHVRPILQESPSQPFLVGCLPFPSLVPLFPSEYTNSLIRHRAEFQLATITIDSNRVSFFPHERFKISFWARIIYHINHSHYLTQRMLSNSNTTSIPHSLYFLVFVVPILHIL